jgi:outer membrane protein assembly factor BamB
VSPRPPYVTGGLDTPAAVRHELYAFDAKAGDPVWPAPFSSPSGKYLLLAAVADGRVFAAGVDGNLYVLDAAHGTVTWTAPIHSSLSPNAGISGGILFVTSDDRAIHAIDIESHLELWVIPVTGTPGAPAIVDGRIIVTTSLGSVISLTTAVPRTASP